MTDVPSQGRSSPDDKPRGRGLGWEVRGISHPFSNRWLTLRQDDLRIDGKDITYTYVQAAPAVFVVPITPQGELVLIRQYRYTYDDWCLELPAGGTGDRGGLAPVEAAREELREEIGGVCDEMRTVGSFYGWGSRSDQVVYVFLAIGVRLEAEPEPEITERIELVLMPVPEVFVMARRGEIRDGQSLACLLLCENLLRELGYVP